MFKELLNKQIEVKKKLNDFIEKNSIYEENNINTVFSDMKTFKLETIEDVKYYQSLIDEDKEISKQIALEHKNYKLMQERINKINNITKK